MEIRIPDPQHVMLDALHQEVDRLADSGKIDTDTVQYLYENEPESIVFFGEDLDHDYVDMEEAMETIRAVGERDLQSKIDYWVTALERLKEEA